MSQNDETFGVVKKPKRASRKRAVQSDETEIGVALVPKKRAPRKKTTAADDVLAIEKVPLSKPVRSRSEKVAERKAPTPIAASRAALKSTRRQFIVVALLIIIGVGASAGVGFTDKGSIDVNQTITQRNERITRGEIQGEIVQAENTNKEPDGGLIGLPVGEPQATSTNSSANSTFTSTSSASSTEQTGTIPMTTEEAEAAAAAAKSKNATSTN